MSASVFGQTLISALLLSSVYALFALGLTLVFGLLDIINFAHGQLLLGGAYVTYALVKAGTGFWIALVAAVACVALLGALLDRVLFARVRNEPISGLLLSVALIAILEGVYRNLWGIDPLDVKPPLTHVWKPHGVVISADVVLVVVGTIVILAALAFLLRRTMIGRAVRATGQNPEAAALMGIAVERIRTLTFAVGAGLAALAGALLTTVFPVEPALGVDPLLKGFIVLILGGAGSPLGAVLGAVLVGFVESFGTQLWTASTASILEFCILIAVLYWRPQGLIRVHRVGTL